MAKNRPSVTRPIPPLLINLLNNRTFKSGEIRLICRREAGSHCINGKDKT